MPKKFGKVLVRKVAERHVSRKCGPDHLYEIVLVTDMGVWRNPDRDPTLRTIAKRSGVALSKRLGNIPVEVKD